MNQTKGKRIAVYQYRSFSVLRGATLKTVTSLAKAGYDVTLTVLPPRDDDAQQEPDRMDDQLVPGLTIRRVRLWSRRLPRYRATALKFAELIIRHWWHVWRSDFDLYIGFDAPAALPVYLGTLFKRQKHLYLALELFAEMPWVSGRPLWQLVERFLCPRVDAIVAMDEYRAKHMLERYKARRAPLTIRNTPPYREVRRQRRFQDLLQAHGCEATKVALCQGQIDAGRNLELIIDSATGIDKDIALVFLGWGEPSYVAELERRIERNGVRDRVMLHPPVLPHEVWDFMGSAHLGLLVYRNLSLNYYYSAGASLRFHEYLMAGLPVVAPNFPGYPDVVEKERVGRCVDPDDGEAIIRAINEILADDAEWRAMQGRALALAKQTFNWENDGGRLVNLCGELMAH